MALIKCVECAADVFEKAEACPKCGHPISAPGTAQVPQTPVSRRKKPMSTLGIIGVTLGGILLAVVVAYKFVLGLSAKKELAAVVSNTAIGQHIVPWPDKAEATVRRLLSGSSGANIGRSIQTLAHPTGKNGAIAKFEIRHMGDQLSVRIDETWQGGFLGSKNSTTIVWDFDQKRHIAGRVLGDSGALGIDSAHAQKLDQYFASEVYPVLRDSVGE